MRHPALTSVLAALGALLAAGVLIQVAGGYGIPAHEMLRDPAAEFDTPIHAGSISFLGVLLLIVAATATGMASALARDRKMLFLGVAVLSLMMSLDDQFLLHEDLVPNLLGVPEIVVMEVYAAAILAVAIGAWRSLGPAMALGLLPALGFLALSAVADLPIGPNASIALEDLSKLAGFAAWCAFWVRTAMWGIQRSGCPSAEAEAGTSLGQIGEN